MSRLFVIEAPGKVRTLEAILARNDFASRVQATKGHLYQMPDKLDPVGIDANLYEFERKPRDLKVIEWLRKEATLADEVFIATDADAEGDVIAWDVYETIRDLHPAPMRVRLKGMDDDSVKAAIAEAAPVRKQDAVPGRTRAIVDRLIGAGFSGNGVAVGRVGTALLGLVASDGGRVQKMTLVAPAKDGGRPFSAEIEVGGIVSLDDAQKLIRLDLPALEMASSAPAQEAPGNTGDIMVRAGDRLDVSPAEVSNSMQRLYEAGRMSYPRAGSRGLSTEASLKIAAVLKKAGYRVDGSAYSPKGENDAHDAPHPIGNVDPGKDPERMGTDEAVRTMVARDLVKSGQDRIEEKPVVNGLIGFLESKGFSHEVAMAIARMPWKREVGPRYPGQESWPESEIVTRRADSVLLERAMKYNLGRPSTWGRHIETFMARGLVTEDLHLTAKGQAWLRSSPQELLDPRVSAAIEAACEQIIPAHFENDDLEPWQLNAARILRALPGRLKPVVEALYVNEAPRERIDPIKAYGTAPEPAESVLQMAEDYAALPVYAPREDF